MAKEIDLLRLTIEEQLIDTLVFDAINRFIRDYHHEFGAYPRLVTGSVITQKLAASIRDRIVKDEKALEWAATEGHRRRVQESLALLFKVQDQLNVIAAVHSNNTSGEYTIVPPVADVVNEVPEELKEEDE